MTKRLQAEKFIEIWQKADDMSDVLKQCNQYGMTEAAVRARVHNYRKKGVSLKKIGRPKKLDWERLRTYAESLQ